MQIHKLDTHPFAVVVNKPNARVAELLQKWVPLYDTWLFDVTEAPELLDALLDAENEVFDALNAQQASEGLEPFDSCELAKSQPGGQIYITSEQSDWLVHINSSTGQMQRRT